MYKFFAFMNRKKYIERWSLMRSTVKENIMEHSEQVAEIAHALALIRNTYFGGNLNADKIAVYALYHEASEVITGDLPTPIKYYNPAINQAYKELEKIASDKLEKTLPTELQSLYSDYLNPDGEEKIIVKAADKLAAYIKCIEEISVGNKEFVKAKASIGKTLESYTLPEVKYFIENFIPAFSLTLDELE